MIFLFTKNQRRLWVCKPLGIGDLLEVRTRTHHELLRVAKVKSDPANGGYVLTFKVKHSYRERDDFSNQ